MLRIQSLAFTSRSESTRTSHLFSKHKSLNLCVKNQCNFSW